MEFWNDVECVSIAIACVVSYYDRRMLRKLSRMWLGGTILFLLCWLVIALTTSDANTFSERLWEATGLGPFGLILWGYALLLLCLVVGVLISVLAPPEV